MKHACLIEHCTVAYGETPVLLDITTFIPRGVICAVIGPNGAGKTTFIKALLGLVDTISGSITTYDMVISYVPQRRSIDWDFPVTVLDVVLMGRYRALGWFKKPTEDDRRMALQALAHVRLADYANRPINQLSGGERQRIFLARSLVQEADLYIMDEPFVGVDAFTERIIVDVLKSLRAQGKTIIVVHHDLQTMQEYFDWMIVLNIKLIAAGPIQEVFTQRTIEQAYGALPSFLKIQE